MDEQQQSEASNGEFTKDQQDVYFHDERCPLCGSEELLHASW